MEIEFDFFLLGFCVGLTAGCIFGCFCIAKNLTASNKKASMKDVEEIFSDWKSERISHKEAIEKLSEIGEATDDHLVKCEAAEKADWIYSYAEVNEEEIG